MSEEGKSRGLAGEQSSQIPYGTFQGVANYPPPPPAHRHQPVIGIPQPVPPPGYYSQGYQTVPGASSF